MDQKEIQKNEINNRITSIKSLYERGNSLSKTDNSSIFEKAPLKSNALDEKIKLFQSQLNEFEEKRRKSNFADITKKFGLNSGINSEDFQSRLKKFEKKESSNSNSNITGFINETNSLIENYEKEIEFLRGRLNELGGSNSNNNNNSNNSNNIAKFKGELEVVTHIEGTCHYEVLASNKNIFFKHMKDFTDKDPSFNDLTMIYNEKITELFEENEKLQNMLKDQGFAEKEIISLKGKVGKLQSTVEEKDAQIKNINDIYQDKFEELFLENSNLLTQMEDLKKSKETGEDNYHQENKQLKEIVVKDESKIKDLESQIKNYENRVKEYGERNKDLESKVSDLDSKLKEEQDVEKRLLEKVGALERKINLADDKVNLLEKENSELNVKLQEYKNNSEGKKHKESELESMNKVKIEELESKLTAKEKEIKELSDTINRLEKKSQSMKEDNDNLREIITKDQIKIKELKEFKERADGNNKDTDLIIEENNLLKQELDLFRKKVETEVTKSEEVTANASKYREETEKKMIKRDKAIEKMNKVIEDFKVKVEEKNEKIKELSQHVEKLSTRIISEKKANSSKHMPQVNLNDGQLKSSFSSSIPSKSQQTTLINNTNITINTNNPVNTTHINTENYLYDSKDFIIDYIFNLYLYDNSINLQQMIDITLNNFNLQMSSIFSKSNSTYTSFSYLQEFAEDLYLLIFDSYVKSCIQGNSEIQKSKPDFWMVNCEDLNAHPEIIPSISERVLKSNIITRMNSLYKKQKTVDELIDYFLMKYEKLFSNLSRVDSYKLTEFLKKEVKMGVIEKIEGYKNYIKEEMKTLFNYASHNFHSGKIVYNGKELYDFSNFYQEYLKRDVRVVDTIYVGANGFTSNDSVDQLIFSIRSNEDQVNSLYFVESFNSHTDSALSRVSLTLIMYSQMNLVNLAITNCIISQEQVYYLGKIIEFMKGLKFLDLSGNDLQEEGVKVLSESLKVNKSITALHLDRNNIEPNGGFYLADALMKNQTLEKLSLSRNHINDNGLYSLLTVLSSNNHSVKYLDISDNQLIVNDFKNVSEFIQTSNTINVLNLSHNFIEQQSANFLGLAIKQAPKLSVLIIQNTGLYDENAPLILTSLAGSPLKEVYLDDNPLGEVVAILLMNVLRVNQNIHFLSLKNCNLSAMSLMCFAKIFDENSNNIIKAINLENNTFDDKSIELLHKNISGKNIQIYLTGNVLSAKSKEIVKNSPGNFILY